MKINLKITTFILGAVTALSLVLGLTLLAVTKWPETNKKGLDFKMNELLETKFIKSSKSKGKNYESSARTMQIGAVFTVIITPIFGVATAGAALAWYKKVSN